MKPFQEILIQAWLPVMKEIERMGHNPVRLMFEPSTVKTAEIVYRALTVCKKKYPKWYSVMAKGCTL
jgi:hypothetical protein